jgi:hypothetical protein
MVTTNMGVFCSALSTTGRRRQALLYRWWGHPPYKIFLKVPRVNKRLASSDITFRTRKKTAGAKIGEYLFKGKHEKGVGSVGDLGNHQADFFISTASSVMIVKRPS